MAKYRVAWLPGDGVGVDVMHAARLVLDGIGFHAEYIHGDIGWEFWKKEGNPLPDRTLRIMRQTDCALFGAITSKPKEEAEAELDPSLKGKGLIYSSPIVRLRQEFQLYANLRPCRAFENNPLNYRDDIDLVVFRENTEGLYAGLEFHPIPAAVREVLEANHKKMAPFKATANEDMAMSIRLFTREACRRIVHKAFTFAKEHGYKSVTVVEKPNVIRETSGLMVREARKVAEEFKGSGVELWEANVDAMAMWLVKNPQNYGVLVSSNMFGDIISDLCAQLVGGLGFAASGNIADKYAVFEPTHGSAPKYEGMDKVNPIAMILSAKLMLDWLGEKEMARKVMQGVANVVKEGKVRTYDMGGSSKTSEMAAAIAEAAKKA
ncbi:MAG: isocitrate/isopropylmalate dehydrogenase family protein [Candidatus Eisenbacteria bacterium]|uniref:Isocitrate/isopropylmalate dehydrogenase family protein n=1 Tax=Eiseniibacteriota bacterium TaxID=2212470 RepID=A0A948W2L5_UNCEI|nr:isocitrate/isopropylmalate dehydrogenase family protein [Candidatus Eisenbacteria bacterium]MBU1950431.1 isocitrate/isopropylmalate dehydrogenase family protein [Candidatus Eisenbacteria bacterium]MBU2690097.1 isocitrate/isopropylmalate dehydrogenase family protein [Candidatus Eisenbacteria bacterium]